MGEWKWRNPEFLSDEDWQNTTWHRVVSNVKGADHGVVMWAQFGNEHFGWIFSDLELIPDINVFLYGHVGLEEGDTIAFHPGSGLEKLLPTLGDIDGAIYIEQIMLMLPNKSDDPSPYFKVLGLDGRITVNGYNLDRASISQLRKLRAAQKIIKPFLSAIPKSGAPIGNKNNPERNVPSWILEEVRQRTYRYKDDDGIKHQCVNLEAFALAVGFSKNTIQKALQKKFSRQD